MANENKEANGLPVYKAKSYLLLTLREVKAKYLKLLPEAKPVAFFQHPKQKVPLYRLDQCEQIVVIGEFNGLPIYWKKPTDLFTDSDLRQMGLELISKAEPTAVLKREKSRIGDYLYTISQSIPRWKWEKNHFGDAIPASKSKKFHKIAAEPNIDCDLKTLPQKKIEDKYGCSVKMVRKLKRYFSIALWKYKWNHQFKNFQEIVTEPNILSELKTLLAKEVEIKYGCSTDTIRKLKDYFGIPRLKYKRVRQPKIFQQIAAEPDIFNDLKTLSQKAIKAKYGCSVTMVRKLKRYFGIALQKHKWTHQFKNFQEIVTEPNILSELKTLTIKELKEKYGCSAYTVRNLKQHFGISLQKYQRKNSQPNL